MGQVLETGAATVTGNVGKAAMYVGCVRVLKRGRRAGQYAWWKGAGR